jgi:uroporphyrinogen-III decarboxylase
MDQLSNIKRLVEEIENQIDSDKNKEIGKKWEAPEVSNTFYHCKPKRIGQMPIVADFEYPMWAKLLNFNLKDYYFNHLTYLEKQLETYLYRYNVFKDDAGLGRAILIWFGAAFEASILGCKVQYPDNFDPSVVRSYAPVTDEESLKRLEDKEIDFGKDGDLGRAHEFYYRIKEILPSTWQVIFPDWIIGPFGIAIYLRGYQNILLDLVDNPEFVVRIMNVAKNKLFEFSKKRAKFLGINIEKICLHNDDVNYPNLLKGTFKDLILPVENEISSHYGGVVYWHSCGVVNDLIDEILDLKNISTLDCSGWNDFDLFVEAITRKNINHTCIEKRFHPVKDILATNDSEIRNKIKNFYISLQKNKNLKSYLRVDGIGQIAGFDETVNSVKRFIDISREYSYLE